MVQKHSSRLLHGHQRLCVFCRDDAQTLACSILRAAGVDATSKQLPAAVAAAVAGYDALLAERVSALAGAVWAAARALEEDR